MALILHLASAQYYICDFYWNPTPTNAMYGDEGWLQISYSPNVACTSGITTAYILPTGTTNCYGTQTNNQVDTQYLYSIDWIETLYESILIAKVNNLNVNVVLYSNPCQILYIEF